VGAENRAITLDLRYRGMATCSLARARHKTLLLLFGDELPPLVAPLANLASVGPPTQIPRLAG
jgi:hypothetical protein